MPNAQMEAEVIRDALDQREQQLYLRFKAGKSLSGLAAVYGRTYGGENGVQEKLNELTLRIQERVGSRAAGGSASAQLQRLAQEDAEHDDNAGGLPIKSVPAGSITGRGAGGEAGPVEAPTPPIPPAPRPAPRSDPSPNGLHAPASSPAPASRVAAGGRTQAERDAAERDERVRKLLEEEPRSAASIAQTLGCDRGIVRKSLERLQRRHVAEPTGEATWDFERSAQGGPPATAWRLVGDSRKVRNPAPTPHPATAASRNFNAEREEKVLALLMERARSQRALGLELDMRASMLRTTLASLLSSRKIRRTAHAVHDWPGCRPGIGRPSTVWEAIDGPSYLAPAPEREEIRKPESEPAPKPAPPPEPEPEVEPEPEPEIEVEIEVEPEGGIHTDRLVDLSRADALAVVLAVRDGVVTMFEGIIAVLEDH